METHAEAPDNISIMPVQLWSFRHRRLEKDEESVPCVRPREKHAKQQHFKQTWNLIHKSILTWKVQLKFWRLLWWHLVSTLLDTHAQSSTTALRQHLSLQNSLCSVLLILSEIQLYFLLMSVTSQVLTSFINFQRYIYQNWTISCIFIYIH